MHLSRAGQIVHSERTGTKNRRPTGDQFVGQKRHPHHKQEGPHLRQICLKNMSLRIERLVGKTQPAQWCTLHYTLPQAVTHARRRGPKSGRQASTAKLTFLDSGRPNLKLHDFRAPCCCAVLVVSCRSIFVVGSECMYDARFGQRREGAPFSKSWTKCWRVRGDEGGGAVIVVRVVQQRVRRGDF